MNERSEIAQGSTEELFPEDRLLASDLRVAMDRVCHLADQLYHRDWDVEMKFYADDIGRWHGIAKVTKQVTL